MSELNQISKNSFIGTNDLQSSSSIKQTEDNPVFKNFQSKGEDIFNKSISGRAASIVSDITKGFFKEFFGVKFKEGAIPEEDISSKEGGVSEGNNVPERVTAKKVLKGIAGTFLALPFLIGTGPLYIANMVRFAAKKEEDIYEYDLNKFLQSSLQSNNVKDKEQAISHLSKTLAKNENIFAEDKQNIKYDVAQNFSSDNAEQIVACLDPKHPDLCAKTISFLVEISNNDSYSFCNNIIFRNKDLVAKNIVKCLDTENPDLRAAAINLLTEMLKKEDIEVEGGNHIMGCDVKNLACEIIIKDCYEKIEKCLKSDNLNLKANTILLLTEILNNEPYSFCNIIGEGKALSENIVKCLDTENPDLRAGAINLFTKMLRSEILDVAAIAGETIKRCFESDDLNLKANTISLLTEMLNNNPTTLHNIIGKDKSLSAKNIAECLTLENLNLCAGTINLLIKMLENKNLDVKDAARKFFYNESLQQKIKDCLTSGDLNLKVSTIALLTEISDKNPSSFCNIISKDKTLSGNIVKCLNPENQDLCGGTIDLLINVLGSKHKDVKSAVRKVFYNDKYFLKQIIRFSKSKDPSLKNNVIALFRIVEKDFKEREKVKALARKSKE